MATLPVSKRRYNFPSPGCDGQGERAYTLQKVEKLRVSKRLLGAGSPLTASWRWMRCSYCPSSASISLCAWWSRCWTWKACARIGHRLMVRLYVGHIECWLGGQRVLERPRATVADGQRHARDID